MSRRLIATPVWNRAQRLRAFTLVEVLVWIAVVALVARLGYGLVAPYAQQRKLRGGAERVAAALEFAREVAHHDARAVRVRVQPRGTGPGENSVRLRYSDSDSSVVHPLTKAAYRLDPSIDPNLGGITVLQSDAGADDTLEFDARGEPVDPGADFLLGCGDYSLWVHVEPVSGRVTIEETNAMAAISTTP